MGKQSPALDRKKAKRLGVELKRLRIAQDIPATKLAETTGLSRSYLSYLEGGRFAEIGLDKFARIVAALDADPDEVLRKAGYLPPRKKLKFDPVKVLREGLDLTLRQAESATAFAMFLKSKTTRTQRGTL